MGKSELSWNVDYDVRIPVSTHSGKMMLKHLEVAVHYGETVLGHCMVPLCEVAGVKQEYRLMSKNHLAARPALAGKGRVQMILSWMKSDIEDSRHLFGTSLARLLATGRGFKTLPEKTAGSIVNQQRSLYREPPDYPQLKGEQLVLSAFALNRSNVKNRSLS